MARDPLIPFILEGQVIRTDDPDQMGRVKVWVPALDGEDFDATSLPWAEYAPVLAGFTTEYPAGRGVENKSHAAYGFWAVPKMGASVFIFCLAGDPLRRFYFASSIRLHRNRSLPAGRNADGSGKPGPWGDDGDKDGNLNPIQPAFSNLREQFQDNVTQSEAVTRGAYERQAAQAQFDKDGKEGYARTPVSGDAGNYLDAQTYCFVTPGRHALIFQDHPNFSRARLKTAEGHQVILDDVNERIYVSSAKGKTWIEMDLDGHINIFGADSISVRSGLDINLFADRDINIEAGRGIHLKADTADIRMTAKKDFHWLAAGDAFISSCGNFNINSEKTLKITSINNTEMKAGDDFIAQALRGMSLKAGEVMKSTASAIHLNGPEANSANAADCPEQAQPPAIVPGHEPWTRPVSKIARGPNWKS